jgi:hypothetical protein
MNLKIPAYDPVEGGCFLEPAQHLFFNHGRLQSKDPLKFIRPDTTTMPGVLGVEEAEIDTERLAGFIREPLRKGILEHLVPQPAPYLNNVHQDLFT